MLLSAMSVHDLPMPITKRYPASEIHLRPIEDSDIPLLFEHQLNPDANKLAAVHPRGEHAFRSLFENVRVTRDTTVRAIVADGQLAGHITIFGMDGRDAVGYWISQDHWGRGIATRALELILKEVATRPLIAYVATHNVASIRVLEKCGFVIVGNRHSPESERYMECEEAILELT